MNYDTTRDIYRLGVIFIELITNNHANTHDFINRELPGYIFNNDNIQQGWPEIFLRLAESCCTNVINLRPSANYIVETITTIIIN